MTSTPSATMIPPLDAAQLAHAARMQTALHAAFATAGGWLSFADYMQLALYAPGLGYYSAGAVKFGTAGDFVTAPEISPLFAPLVVASITDVLGSEPFAASDVSGGSVLELGAGTGRFAAAALRALDSAQCLPQRYDILEVSADLRERQRGVIAAAGEALAARAHWLDRLPQQFQGVMFANEVLDALVTERFVMRAGAPRLLGVQLGPQGLRASERAHEIVTAAAGRSPAQPLMQSPAVPQSPYGQRELAIAQRLGALVQQLPDGYVGECCLGVSAWISALAAALQRGVVLLVDYGLPRAQLYHPQRQQGSLRCFFQHRAHDDALFRPGFCDISAWVDFTAVAEAAAEQGLQLLGFTTQAAFLLENGIESLLAREMPEVERTRLAHGARQLLLPGEMGESVKVMALARDYDGPMRGFSLQDLTGRL